MGSITLMGEVVTIVHDGTRSPSGDFHQLLERVDWERAERNEVEDHLTDEETESVTNGAIFPVDERWALVWGGCEGKP